MGGRIRDPLSRRERVGVRGAPADASMCGDADAGIRPVSTSTGNRTADAVLRVSFTWNGILETCFPARSARWIIPPAQSTTDFESGVHAIPG